MILKLSTSAFLLALLISCSSSPKSPKEYVNFIRDPENGLVQSKDAGPLRFEVQYEPLEYVCLIQNGRPEITAVELRSLKSEFEGLTYFKFTISSKQNDDPLTVGVTDSTQLVDRITYLAGQANKDFWLLQQTDTVRCLLHHFERNYGIVPRVDITLAFEKLKTETSADQQPLLFCFRDRIFHSGDHQFVFPSSVFESNVSVKTN